MLVGLREGRWRSSVEAALRADLKARIARSLRVGENDAVTVNQIACADPGCPDAETVILLMRAGKPARAYKLSMPMTEVTETDLDIAASALLPAG